METNEQIAVFREIIEKYYLAELLQQAASGKYFLHIDFTAVSQHDPVLANILLENPTDLIKTAELAIREFDIDEETAKLFKVRFNNLPDKERILIRDLRSNHLNKFVVIEGTVRQKSDVRPRVVSAKFECRACGNTMQLAQTDQQKFNEPTKCSACSYKGKFRLLAKELVDAQGIFLEESSSDLEGGEQPKRLNIYLEQDLVSPMTEKQTNPGSSIRVVGILQEIQKINPKGGMSTKFDLVFNANSVTPLEEDYSTIKITEEEEEEILQLAKDPKASEKLVQAVAPGIYGHDKIKHAILLQFLGGVTKTRDDGVKSRGDMHILLVGDPGAGKSQLLKRAAVFAPKSRYVSGRGASGAGLTAAVVRDEFMNGWALEAGALVLANKGIALIDELDKMTPDDRNAMHEALEQQCFHPETKIMLADGTEVEMGSFVERIFARHPKRIVQGKDCVIADVDNLDLQILSTDWQDIFPVNITKVSKHTPFDFFYTIEIGNGRKITVTPDHPVFCIEEGEIITKSAKDLTGEEWVPVPLVMPIHGEVQALPTCEQMVYNANAEKHITVPTHNDEHLYKILGYYLSEGSQEINRGKAIGINFTNKNVLLLNDFARSMEILFGLKPYEQIRHLGTPPCVMIRYVSTELQEFFEQTCPEMLEKSHSKKIPGFAMRGDKREIKYMLQAMVEGDGHVAKKEGTIRIGFASNSRIMCEQFQDLLLRYAIRSNLTEHKDSYKVSITGYENISKYHQEIGFLTLKKIKIVEEYLRDKSPIRTIKNIVPNVQKQVIYLLEKYGIKRVGLTDINTMKNDYLRLGKNISVLHLRKVVRAVEGVADKEDFEVVKTLKDLAFGKIGFEKIKKISKEKNRQKLWAYDVTIEPHHTFISQNMVLHNTVTISKANIQATLRCETSVLAAANPKMGRFDPFENIAKQIDLPPSLINRFDLIFPIRDLPDEEKDSRLAAFILNLHQSGSNMEPEIETNMLRKYISYAREQCHPKITSEATEELKNYFVRMRNQTTNEDGSSTIGISARQLEGLVRMTEAAAKIRMSEVATKDDAKTAIGLLEYCLQQIGIDPETGKIDIDKIQTGFSSSQRKKIIDVRELIKEVEQKVGKEIPMQELIDAAAQKGMDPDKVEEAIHKLKLSGDIYEPRRGTISRL